jgi:hypothetical protein
MRTNETLLNVKLSHAEFVKILRDVENNEVLSVDMHERMHYRICFFIGTVVDYGRQMEDR